MQPGNPAADSLAATRGTCTPTVETVGLARLRGRERATACAAGMMSCSRRAVSPAYSAARSTVFSGIPASGSAGVKNGSPGRCSATSLPIASSGARRPSGVLSPPRGPERLGEYARRHHPNRSQASRGRYRAGQGVAGDAATHPGLYHRAFEPEPVHEAVGTRSCHFRRGFIRGRPARTRRIVLSCVS
jgi:hypothetical protein